jgi:cell wall-associated NlpC family hydrolase
MPTRTRLFLLAALASLILVPSASADQHWQDQNWDNGPAYQPQPTPTPTPTRTPTDSGGGWDSNQGDSQETPQVWNQAPVDDPWSSIPALPVSKRPTVAGSTAMIRRNGLAAIPTGAPASVRAIITAANQIIGKPYKWGGGHGRLFDSGYDCSGSVSYALIRSGLLAAPMVSGTLARWGAKGLGKYVTIYANVSHVYMEVAGLRLDTSSVGDRGGKSGVRWRPLIGKRFGFAVRHVSGL